MYVTVTPLGHRRFLTSHRADAGHQRGHCRQRSPLTFSLDLCANDGRVSWFVWPLTLAIDTLPVQNGCRVCRLFHWTPSPYCTGQYICWWPSPWPSPWLNCSVLFMYLCFRICWPFARPLSTLAFVCTSFFIIAGLWNWYSFINDLFKWPWTLL